MNQKKNSEFSKRFLTHRKPLTLTASYLTYMYLIRIPSICISQISRLSQGFTVLTKYKKSFY